MTELSTRPDAPWKCATQVECSSRVEALRQKIVAVARLSLSLAEHFLVRRSAKPAFPPIFIIGAPRTGSTLFYQALTNRYRVSYIDNFMARFPRAICSASHLSRVLFGERPHDTFASAEGRTRVWNAPSECGEFWYRWFPREPAYTPAGAVTHDSVLELQAVVAAIVRAWGLPLVFKNMYCALRLAPLREAFPGALFIHCKRDPLYCGQSLLRTRERVFGDMKVWWSMKPKEYDGIRHHHYCEQVIEQIYYIERQIEQDLRLFREGQSFTVNYEVFCARPRDVLREVRRWLSQQGIDLQLRAVIPSQFRASRRLDLPVDDLTKLQVAIQKYFAKGPRCPSTGRTPGPTICLQGGAKVDT